MNTSRGNQIAAQDGNGNIEKAQPDNSGTHDLLNLYERCLNGEDIVYPSSGDSEVDVSEEEDTVPVVIQRSRRRMSKARRSSIAAIFKQKAEKPSAEEFGDLVNRFYQSSDVTQFEADFPEDVANLKADEFTDKFIEIYDEVEKKRDKYPALIIQANERDFNQFIKVLNEASNLDTLRRKVVGNNEVKNDTELDQLISQFEAKLKSAQVKLSKVKEQIQTLELVKSIECPP